MHYFYSGRNISTPAGINTFVYILPVACGVKLPANKKAGTFSPYSAGDAFVTSAGTGSDGNAATPPDRRFALTDEFCFPACLWIIFSSDSLEVYPRASSLSGAAITDNTYCFVPGKERAISPGDNRDPCLYIIPCWYTSFSCGYRGCSIRMILVRIYCTV